MNQLPTEVLGQVIKPISRAETVQAGTTYRILGARWYAGGLFIKDVCDGSSIRAPRVFRVENGDFVYNRLFAWKGSFAVAGDADAGCYVSNEFPCFRPDATKIDARYLHYYASREPFWTEALGLSSGGTPTSRNRLKEEKLLAMTIPLPPLPEQCRIVARIEELAAQIQEARALREKAQMEAIALLHSYRRNRFGENPQDNWIPLNQYVTTIQNGKSPATEGRPASLDEWAVLKVGAVSFGVFNEFENKALPPSYAVPPELEVHSGDFIMSRANMRELVGACALVRKVRPKLMLSDKTFRFVFREPQNVLPEYLEHALKSPALRDQIERGASGTSPTMKNISKEKVMALRLPPFNLAEQRHIAAELNALQSQVDALQKLQAETASQLDALLPSILDKAFKGEL